MSGSTRIATAGKMASGNAIRALWKVWLSSIPTRPPRHSETSADMIACGSLTPGSLICKRQTVRLHTSTTWIGLRQFHQRRCGRDWWTYVGDTSNGGLSHLVDQG